jgi:YegS/Rv2252/BmrU family lipid kinase
VRIFLIVNPTAGQGRAAQSLPTIVRGLSEHGASCEVFETTQPGEAQTQAHAAAQDGYEVIVAAGGDGTIHEVLNGMVGSSAALGVIPVGTENVLGKAFNLPFNVEEACRIIRRCAFQTLDVGRCSTRTMSRYFLLMAGLGFDAQVVRDVSLQFKRRAKSWAFFLKGFSTIARWQPVPVTVTTEDMRLTDNAWEVLISNAPRFAWGVRIAPDAAMSDGLFDVCVFRQPSRLGFIVEALDSLFQRQMTGRGVERFQAQRVTVQSTAPLPVQLDGESVNVTATTVTFHVVPRAVRVIVSGEW